MKTTKTSQTKAMTAQEMLEARIKEWLKNNPTGKAVCSDGRVLTADSYR